MLLPDSMKHLVMEFFPPSWPLERHAQAAADGGHSQSFGKELNVVLLLVLEHD